MSLEKSTIPGVPILFRNKARQQAIAWWRGVSPKWRAQDFREFVRGEIMRAQAVNNDRGMRDGALQVYSYQENALECFIQHVILNKKDDTAAADLVVRLHVALSYYEQGTIPNALLYRKACGPRVRAELLKTSWTHGRSGSVLALNAPSRMMCWNYFKEANAEYLMNAVERRELAALGKTVRLYRGAKMKYDDLGATAFALSWTPDYDIAHRFAAHGYGEGEGVILRADVPRDAVGAWWFESGREPEAIVNPKRLRNVQIVERIAERASVADLAA